MFSLLRECCTHSSDLSFSFGSFPFPALAVACLSVLHMHVLYCSSYFLVGGWVFLLQLSVHQMFHFVNMTATLHVVCRYQPSLAAAYRLPPATRTARNYLFLTAHNSEVSQLSSLDIQAHLELYIHMLLLESFLCDTFLSQLRMPD